MGFKVIQAISTIKLFRSAFRVPGKDAYDNDVVQTIGLAAAKDGYDALRASRVRVIIFDSDEDMAFFDDACAANGSNDVPFGDVAKLADILAARRLPPF